MDQIGWDSLWIVFFPVFHFSVEGSAVIWHREPASQPFCFRSQNIHDPLPFAPPPPTLLPGTRDGGALSQCELHQDDEHHRENKLPSTLWSSRHGAISAAYSRTWLPSYGITNEVQCPAMSKPRRSSRNQRLRKIAAVKTSHENEPICPKPDLHTGNCHVHALSHAKPTINREGNQENLYWVSHFWCEKGSLDSLTMAASCRPRLPVSEPLRRPLVFAEQRLKTGPAHPDGSCSLVADCV